MLGAHEEGAHFHRLFFAVNHHLTQRLTGPADILMVRERQSLRRFELFSGMSREHRPDFVIPLITKSTGRNDPIALLGLEFTV